VVRAAIRAFVDRAGHPAETWEDDETVMEACQKAHGQAITWLHRDGQLPSIAWIHLIPDTPDRRAASSRAEVMRWAIGRIRENPAYAQIQEKVSEISELKDQF
jgi:hypothetical protein